MVNPAFCVPVACRVTVVHPAGSGPVLGSLTALTIWGAVSGGASVPVPVDDVPGEDEPPDGVLVVLCRSSTMVAAPAPAPSTASSTSASHNPVRRLRGAAAARLLDGPGEPVHGADPAAPPEPPTPPEPAEPDRAPAEPAPAPAEPAAPDQGCAEGAAPDLGAG